MDNIGLFISAITSYGGDDYPTYELFYNEENKSLYESWLLCQPKVAGIPLYRGYSFDEQYIRLDLIHLGDTLSCDHLTQDSMPSFTSQKLRALRYMNEYGEVMLENPIRVLFEIHTSGKYFVDISSLSIYKEEKEYKCVDSARFEVKSIERRPGYYKIELVEI